MSKINYFNQETDSNGYVYSVDNVRINFQINPHYLDDFVNYFIKSVGRLDISMSPLSTADFKFRYLIKVSYSESACMIIGFGFNGVDSQNDKFKGYIDVNPNKTGSFSQFWADYRQIKSCSEDFVCPRCDIALDVPVKRELIILEKDNRKYGLDAYSLSNRTEYLGMRSNVGFVKVYNKTTESKLDEDITRIEVTCEPNTLSYLSKFPKVYDISLGGQLTTDWLSLKDTDLAILRMELKLLSNGLDNGLMLFNSLGRYEKQKLKQFLLPESCLVFPTTGVVDIVFSKFLASML